MRGFIITPFWKKAQHYKIRLKEDTYPSVPRLLWRSMVRAKAADICTKWTIRLSTGWRCISFLRWRYKESTLVLITFISPF